MTVGTTPMQPLARDVGPRVYLPFYLGAALDLVLGLDLVLFPPARRDGTAEGRASGPALFLREDRPARLAVLVPFHCRLWA